MRLPHPHLHKFDIFNLISLYENPFRKRYFSVASTVFPERRHFSNALSSRSS